MKREKRTRRRKWGGGGKKRRNFILFSWLLWKCEWYKYTDLIEEREELSEPFVLLPFLNIHFYYQLMQQNAWFRTIICMNSIHHINMYCHFNSFSFLNRQETTVHHAWYTNRKVKRYIVDHFFRLMILFIKWIKQ